MKASNLIQLHITIHKLGRTWVEEFVSCFKDPSIRLEGQRESTTNLKIVVLGVHIQQTIKWFYLTIQSSNLALSVSQLQIYILCTLMTEQRAILYHTSAMSTVWKYPLTFKLLTVQEKSSRMSFIHKKRESNLLLECRSRICDHYLLRWKETAP
jgi:hypothetical protein